MKGLVYDIIIILTMATGDMYTYNMEQEFDSIGKCEEAAEIFIEEHPTDDELVKVEARCVPTEKDDGS